VTPACVLLTADHTAINRGDAVTLAWQTRNATRAYIDQGVGEVTPVAAGSTVVRPTADSTTYTLFIDNGQTSAPCQVTVRITNTENPTPACVQLTADRTEINRGDSVVLSWVTSRATKVSIDQGVGSVTPLDSGSVTVNPTGETTYVATVNDTITTQACQVTVRIKSDTCQSGCGGGGGGGRRTPHVSLASSKDQPLGFVYLSQIPYTGLDLGTWGTALYWIALVGWSAALAYLVLFNALPFAYARAKRFGGEVSQALNAPAPARDAHADDHHGHAVASAHHAAPAGHGNAHAHHDHGHAPAPEPKKEGYSSYEGFRSFGGDTLTIDDLVKGLTRITDQAPAATSAYELRLEHKAPETHEAPEREEAHAPAAHAETPAPTAPKAAAPTPAHPEVPAFIQALVNGERETVFGIVRAMTRAGEDVESFLAHATFALDDAYRAHLEGTPVHPEVAKATEGCAPSFLERIVSALTTAVDGSYSHGITGTKLALTRALAVSGA
jgi:hypothetical protein